MEILDFTRVTWILTGWVLVGPRLKWSTKKHQHCSISEMFAVDSGVLYINHWLINFYIYRLEWNHYDKKTKNPRIHSNLVLQYTKTSMYYVATKNPQNAPPLRCSSLSPRAGPPSSWIRPHQQLLERSLLVLRQSPWFQKKHRHWWAVLLFFLVGPKKKGVNLLGVPLKGLKERDCWNSLLKNVFANSVCFF